MKNTEPSIAFKLNIAEVNNTPPNILSQTSIRNFRQTTLGLDVETIDKNFLCIPTVDAAIEVMHYIFGHLDSEKAIVSSMKSKELKHSLMQRLIYNYSYESYRNHELLKKYEINKNAGFSKYKLDSEHMDGIPDKIIPITPDTLTKIQVMCSAFQCSILNRNDKAAKEIFKYIITEISPYFNDFAKEIEQYSKCAEYLLPVLKLIEPESQLKIIQALVPYIKFSLDLSGKFSDLLIENKNFEEAKALLEESMFSFNNNIENQVLVQWYYRAGRAYEETGSYDISTKYYEHAFGLLPTHPTAPYHLWANYRIQGEFDKANDLIQDVQVEYIKHILEMLTNPYKISYEKLDLIKKIP